jgi:2-amino-4-hydroxy-6-hydroxymethyldihydropteridine diphosphokinase
LPKAYVSIGSNVDRERNVRSAVSALSGRYGPLMLSPVYESAAFGFDGDPFYNLVCGFTTGDTVAVLVRELHAIEHRHGRLPGGKRLSARTLDLDILLYGDLVRHDEFDIPRSDIIEHSFVLRPLCDLAPAMQHPELDQTFSQLWSELRVRHALRQVELDLQDVTKRRNDVG